VGGRDETWGHITPHLVEVLERGTWRFANLKMRAGEVSQVL
jgi:hypothetical protein